MSYFARAGVWLGALLVSVMVCGQTLGLAYEPKPMQVTPADLEGHERLLVIFGNSRTEAAFDADRLERALPVGVRVFSGGGWHPLHYYQLARLHAPVLRPSRDLVLLDASLLSISSAPPGRLGAIRPEAALPVVALPELPTEARLDILLGAADPVYRYRSQVEAKFSSRLDAGAERLAPLLGSLRLSGPPPTAPAFTLVTDPDKNFVMKEILGDKGAFRRASRERLTRTVAELTRPAYQLAALERSVTALRERGITVLLLEVPLSRWLTDQLERSPQLAPYRRWLDDLAARTGAQVLREWPEALRDERNFYDDQHLFSAATGPVSDALVTTLRAHVHGL